MSLEDTFREEADELLVDLEAAMLELEETPDDSDCVDRAFRAMHTIKGSGAMFGFDKLAEFTHHLENAFDLVRNGELTVTRDLINIGLDSGDHIRAMLEEKDPDPELVQQGASLLERLGALIPAVGEVARQASAEQELAEARQQSSGEPVDITYRLRLKPSPDTLANGMDPLPILRELHSLGPCHVTTLIGDLPELDRFDPEVCYLSWDIVLTTEQERTAIDDVFIFVSGDWDIRVDVIDDGSQWSDDSKETKPVGQILVEKGDATPEQIELARANQKRIGEVLSEQEHVDADKVKSALEEQKVVKDVRNKRKQKQSVANVKVPADKLDTLMDLVGELVIAQARLNQSAGMLHDSALTSIAEDMERLTTELRDNTLGLRMLPIGTTFARFRRLVRDLSNELGKEIELITEGAETELDKTVIDKLGDPLVHLIRNSIDHGIEAPDVREAAGKDKKGTVKLSAVHSESHVVIKIEDDGAGMNPEVLRQKGIERGLITEEANLTDHELFNLVFEAGFSTAKTVSNVSGRGVGMDVVKRSIESLRGKVIIDSTPGSGSVVTVELPLTLAIIEGLLITVGNEYYVIPLSLVEECIELSSEEVAQANGNRLIEIRGQLVPYLRLRECFTTSGEPPDIEQIVIVRNGEQRFGFTVDGVVGQHQTVIKGLGKMYEGVKGLAGATILGDGAVALILDAPALIKLATDGEATMH